MARLITFFVAIFLLGSMLGAAMDGGGGVAAAILQSNVNSSATTFTVDSTNMFLNADHFVIGAEKIAYTGVTPTTFTGATRGYQNTTAVAHTSGAILYTPDASAINSALGFDAGQQADDFGVFALVTIPVLFVVRTLPHLIAFDFGFLTGTLGIVGYFLLALGIGFVIYLAVSLRGAGRTV